MTRSGSPAAPDYLSRALLPWLLLLFVGSGAAALIYEVVWFQLLELVIGSSAISLGVLLATFMGGMCIGSLAFPKFAPRNRHPLQIYALLELSIGVIGLLELFVIPLAGRMYSPAVGHGAAALVFRAVVAGLCLLPPTIMMGATLPAIARWVESSPRGISWLGFFYGGNIAGAVLGSVAAGFYLLRVYDQSIATYVAVVVNFAVAGIAWIIAARSAQRGDSAADKRPVAVERTPDAAAVSGAAFNSEHTAAASRAVYIAIGISGATALASQVVWTRLLSLTFGASVYTFSMILAVFLTGLGIGSGSGAWISRQSRDPQRTLGWFQACVMAAIAWAALVIFVALPNWPVNPSLAPSPWFAMQLDIVRTALAVLPGAVLWGASFPLALAAIAHRGTDPSRLVGRVYAANTLGAIAGAILCSLVLIPVLGTRDAQRVLIALAGVAAVLALVTAPRASATAKRVALLGVTVVAAVLIAATPQLPGSLVAHGRYAVTWIGRTDVLYVGEGMNSSVAVTRLLANDAIQFHVSGKVEASSLQQDMRLQKMLAHLPALVHPNPQSVLVVGFGAGVTAGSFLNYPSMKRLVICEIEPLIPKVVSTWFEKENNNVVKDPRTQIFYDDARSFVLTTDEQFDIVTSDPINPWVKGAATLYTREYFNAVKRLLKPGGVVTQWVPLYESTLDAVRSELATFFEVFPNGTVWANNINGGGYDVVLLAGNGPLTVDMEQMERRFQEAGYERVASSLVESGFDSPIALFSTYAGSAPELSSWLQGSVINTDRNLRLQYLAGVGLNSYTESSIFREIAQFRTFPDALFVADDSWKAALRQAMGMQ